MAHRTTPTLGPDVEQHSDAYYWDMNNKGAPSYPLGTTVKASDGHDYVHVKAAADFAAAATVNITETTWVAAANETGTYTVPKAVKAGEFFHARKTAA